MRGFIEDADSLSEDSSPLDLTDLRIRKAEETLNAGDVEQPQLDADLEPPELDADLELLEQDAGDLEPPEQDDEFEPPELDAGDLEPPQPDVVLGPPQPDAVIEQAQANADPPEELPELVGEA